MEKRIFLAIVISLGILLGWATLAPKLFPELVKKPQPAKTVTTPSTATSTTSPAATATTTAAPAPTPPGVAPGATPGATSTIAAAAPATPVAGQRVQATVFDALESRAVFSNRGAQLVSYKLKKYNQKKTKQPVELVKRRAADRWDYPFAIVTTDKALTERLNTALYAVTERDDRGKHVIDYRYSDGRVTVTKSFAFSRNQPYLFDFSVAVTPPVPYRVEIGPGVRTLAPEEQDSRIVMTGNGVLQREGKFKVLSREKSDPVAVFPGVDYVGIEDNYFLSVLRPSRSAEGVIQRVVFYEDPKTKKNRPDLYAGLNAANGVVEGQSFYGPKETKLLDRYGLEGALQFGWLGVIARFFLEALVWLNKSTHNYGFAIIVLTILIKVVLYPLQHKSIVSMKKMQKVQPKVDAIKAKYKKSKTDADQRTKMNTEMMQLYQKEGINPMAGCLPLVIQLPILWGFYNLLSRAIELRGAPFMLWIHDLSDKDPTYVLPLLMTITMFVQTYITPSTGDPAQRRIFLIMPLMFGFMFKDFPSGLVLYWLVQNILTIVQQTIMNKWWKTHPEDVQNA
jgi:YidC/Oxa1 family membrane protein insertase